MHLLNQWMLRNLISFFLYSGVLWTFFFSGEQGGGGGGGGGGVGG